MKRYIILLSFIFAFINLSANDPIVPGEEEPCTDSYFEDAWIGPNFITIYFEDCERLYLVEYYYRQVGGGTLREELQITRVLSLTDNNCNQCVGGKQNLFKNAYAKLWKDNPMGFSFNESTTVVKEMQCYYYIAFDMPGPGGQDIILSPSQFSGLGILPPNYQINPDGDYLIPVFDMFAHCDGSVCCTAIYNVRRDGYGQITNIEYKYPAGNTQEECDDSDDCWQNCSSLVFDVDFEDFPKKSIINTEHIKIYPNPNDGDFTFEIRNNSKGTVVLEIIDIVGNTVYKSSFKKTNDMYTSNIETNLNSGVYFINITLDNNNILNSKIEISK